MTPTPAARLTRQDSHWHIDGARTNPGAPAEGLLLNVRMVNAVFEDLHRPELDPADITRRFLESLPAYAASGVNAISLNLQGGYPNYEGCLNSAYAPDGALRPAYLVRVQQVIAACASLGLGVILGCFYQLQSPVLRDEAAVRRAVLNTAVWLGEQGFANVLLEIANEFGQEGFIHPILRSDAGIAELIAFARQVNPDLLASASHQSDRELSPLVCQASDFVLLHLNRAPLEEYPARIAAAQAYGKPVICSEDRKTGEQGVLALEACVRHGCSWGLLVRDRNQYNPPFHFDGPADDPLVYARFKELAALSSLLKHHP